MQKNEDANSRKMKYAMVGLLLHGYSTYQNIKRAVSEDKTPIIREKVKVE